MTRNLLILGIAILGSVSLTTLYFNRDKKTSKFGSELKLGERLPAEIVKDLSGNEFRIDSINDRIVLVNFWASWCEPCAREFPSFLKLADTFGSKIFLVAIAIDTDRHGVDGFLKAFDGNRPNIKILWDPAARSARRFGTDAYPETYIFDSRSLFVEKMIGAADWGARDVLEKIEKLTSSTKSQTSAPK